MSEVDPSRLVFVAGLHRSGTTPLARTLAAHPAVSGLTGTGVKEDEGQHLQSVYPPARTYGGPGRFAFDPRAHLTEDSALATPQAAQALWSAWAPHWDLSRRYLVEKSPPNLVMGRFLQAVFPGSAFVAVVRHPVVVALGTRKWRRLLSRHWENHVSVERMVEHWIAAHRILADDLPALERAVVIRYEDLVSSPQRELGRVADLLGLAEPIPHEGLAARSEAYEREWAAMAEGWWWQRRARRRIIERLGPQVEALGYDCDDLRARTPSSLLGLSASAAD
ncbi:MAG: sulfotransferase family protein [Angustibacter sp.]